MKRLPAIFIVLLLAAWCAGNWGNGFSLFGPDAPADSLVDASTAGDDLPTETAAAKSPSAPTRRATFGVALHQEPAPPAARVTPHSLLAARLSALTWHLAERAAAAPRAPACRA